MLLWVILGLAVAILILSATVLSHVSEVSIRLGMLEDEVRRLRAVRIKEQKAIPDLDVMAEAKARTQRLFGSGHPNAPRSLSGD